MSGTSTPAAPIPRAADLVGVTSGGVDDLHPSCRQAPAAQGGTVAGQLRGADDWYVSGVYVALGDSMSIDDYAGGAGRGAASLLYRNCDGDFPEWAGKDLAASGLGVQILAWDGATAADVLRCQLPLIEQPPAVVTVTMGGNDLLAAFGDTAATETAIGEVIAAGEDILSWLNAASGGAPIVVTTVYDPSDDTGDADAAGWLGPWPEGPAAVRALNAALTSLAGRHGALVADVHGRFLGHGTAAGDPSQALSRPASRDLWYCNIIEPNAWGAHEIRCAWWQALHASAREP